MVRSTRAIDLCWLLLFGGLSSAWCLSAAAELGPTFDEPFYLVGGLHFWRTGSLAPLLDKGTLPLPVVVCTAPLRAWEWLRGQPLDLISEFDDALRLARCSTLLFWWLLLAYGWRTGTRIAGPWGGRLAVAFLACEPTLLAHAALATTDIALAACLLAFAFHYSSGREAVWRTRIGMPAVLFAVALLAKASALAFGVIVILSLELCRQWQVQNAERHWLTRLRSALAALLTPSFLKELVQIAGLGLVLTIAACGSDFEVSAPFVSWADRLPDGLGRTIMHGLAENLAIFSNAGVALARQVQHNMQGHGAYLLGATSPRALWYYFPVALTIKLTLPFLVLPIALLALSPRSLRNGALLLTLALLCFSLTCRVQIGVRMVLPLIVFLAIGLSAGLVNAIADVRLSQWRRGVIGFLTTASVLWMAFSAARVWPHGLCYVNELYGGTHQGFRCVSGSDYDWGQGLRELERWRSARGVELGLIYYGTDPLADSPGYRRFTIHRLPEPSAEGLASALEGRDLAVSVCLLHGPRSRAERLDGLLDYLRTCQPVERTTCFFVYRFGNMVDAE